MILSEIETEFLGAMYGAVNVIEPRREEATSQQHVVVTIVADSQTSLSISLQISWTTLYRDGNCDLFSCNEHKHKNL